MKINLIQTDIVWGDPQANCEHLDKLLASAEPADLYVLPEMFSTGFATLPNATVEHEPAVGLAWMQRKAQELHAAIAGSIALEAPVAGDDEAARCVNRFYFVRPDGTYEQYDKRHLFGYGGEGERFRAGRERVVVKYLGVRFLLAVCYDLRFPVWLRNEGNAYDLLLNVASWPASRSVYATMMASSRAIENMCYVAFCNRVGSDPECDYDGRSNVWDFGGAPLGTGLEIDGHSFVEAEIDRTALMDYREKFPIWRDNDRFTIEL